MLRKFLEKVDRIIVATPNHIDHSYILPEFRDKCQVIPFGIDSKEFEKYQAIYEANHVINVQKIVEIFSVVEVGLFGLPVRF